jgi:TRAP-type C4-dicarboxylate transport system permease large subunit
MAQLALQVVLGYRGHHLVVVCLWCAIGAQTPQTGPTAQNLFVASKSLSSPLPIAWFFILLWFLASLVDLVGVSFILCLAKSRKQHFELSGF